MASPTPGPARRDELRDVPRIRHPDAGELIFEGTLLPLADRPGCNLVLHNPRPGTGTRERLEQLMARRGTAAAS
jgi:hypothetical protein